MSNAASRTDFYKTGHGPQMPDRTELVFANWTPRKSRFPEIDSVILFGVQAFAIDSLINKWRTEFFDLPKDFVLKRYHRRVNGGLPPESQITLDHISDLHDLRYLPLSIYGVPEGTRTPIGAPQFTMWNNRAAQSWLTNYIETSMSANVWGPCTSATIAREYLDIFKVGAKVSGGDMGFVPFQGHDFSYRGMWGDWAAAASGAAHLLSFQGTDTIPALDFLEDFYLPGGQERLLRTRQLAPPIFIGGSIPATEHSVMCMGAKGNELETIRRIITEIHPRGPVSVVVDTWDYWKVLTEMLPLLKDEIMAREGGPVVVRPDSGDPVDILTGDDTAPHDSPARAGTYRILHQIFGGFTTGKGFTEIDPHVSSIYGDSITRDRATRIRDRLLDQGFVPSGVLGIGSYTYQYVTRDTFGYALKTTAGVVNGETRELFKDPKTDGGTKKSAKGFVCLDEDLKAKEVGRLGEVIECPAYVPIFINGSLETFQHLDDIRHRVQA